jgi:hypothetical protein
LSIQVIESDLSDCYGTWFSNLIGVLYYGSS